MSHFSLALRAAIEQKEFSQTRFAELAGVDSGNLSRYLAGTNSPTPQILEKLCLPFPINTRAELAIAHLRDELPPCAKDLVHLEPAGLRIGEQPGSYRASVANNRSKLPRELREALEFYERACAENPEFAQHVLITYRLLKDSI